MHQTARRDLLIPPPVTGVRNWRIPPALAAISLAATYFLIWLIRRTYTALDDDAQLYAFQALARLKPEFGARDLFLAYGSQDSYTLFTPGYAWLIDKIGLSAAASLLTCVFHIWSATAAWFIARRFTTAELAWLATGIVIIVPGFYGAYGVFEYAEPFLTARLPAESLVLTSMALFLSGRRRLAYVVTLPALLMHPLMTAPGIALLILLTCPAQRRRSLIAAGAATCLVVIAMAYFGVVPGLHLMDVAWLDVVRERSFFMFVETWRIADWDWLLLTFVSLVFVAMTNEERAIKDTAVAATIVGAIGLTLASITSVIPVEILIQSQPWRWAWLATYVAVITCVPTWAACWNRDTVTRSALILVYSGWIFPLIWSMPGMIGTPIAGLGLLVYCGRRHISERYLEYFNWLALGVAAIAALSVAVTIASILQLDFTTNREHRALERARDLFALALPAIFIVIAVWFATVGSRFAASVLAVAAITLFGLAIIVPRTYRTWTGSPYATTYSSFAPWRDAVDHQRSVFWFSNPVAVWLLLESPSYLSASQSAGAVFSRGTAAEIQRRAAVLEPLAGHSKLAISRKETGQMKSLTADILQQICSDPQLGYVVSKDELPIAHLNAPKGRWGQMHLYSCDDLHRPAS